MNAGRQRRSARLREYDYAHPGAYFVTICTHSRKLFFESDAIRAIGERCWLEIPGHFRIAALDEWVVMPNHIHGIIVITGSDLNGCDEMHRRGVQLNAPTATFIDANGNHRSTARDPANRHSLISPHCQTLAVIVRTYKAAVTTLCRRAGYVDFQWQRNYYERVIRDDSELNRTRQYIIDNPANWNKDEYHVR